MSKEQVQENVVDANTLFIGIGGIGGRIVKGVAELCREHETDNISFVCLDTNVNDLTAIRDSKARIRYVQISSTETVGSYLNYDEDARNNWFPKNTVMYDKTVSEGAGQVRAISRLALNDTIKTGRIRPLYDAIDELFMKDGRELKQVLRVVFASSASGGTGSGIYLPLSMLVRDYVNTEHPNTGVVIRSLLLLPGTLDSVIKSSVEKQSQRRNAYALIKELNAFMMQGGGYTGIKGSALERYNDTLFLDFPIPGTENHKRLSLLPADFVFLMDGQDAEDYSMYSQKQYTDQAALALYEQNIGPMQKAAFSVEDNIIKEMSNPGNMGRNRFGGIGSSVIRYPYDDVVKYVSYAWAQENIGSRADMEMDDDSAKESAEEKKNNARWTRIDKSYKEYQARERKAGKSETEIDPLSQYYVDQVNILRDSDSFIKDLYGTYLTKAAARINNFMVALDDYLVNAVQEESHIKNDIDSTSAIPGNDYADVNLAAANDFGILQSMRTDVGSNAETAAKRAAIASFWDDTKSANVPLEKRYKIEYVIRNASGEFAHPNAVRYLLYALENRLAQGLQEAEAAADANQSELLDEEAVTGNQRTLADLAALDTETTQVDEKKSAIGAVVDKITGKKDEDKYPPSFFKTLNSRMRGYLETVMEYAANLGRKAGYREALQFVRKMSGELERFYGTFVPKVQDLKRRRMDISDALAYRKGDSVLNVCASDDVLKELVEATATEGNDSGMLDSELDADIYDAIKANVIFDRDTEAQDIIEEDERKDIFDDILLGYFEKKVRTECKLLDMNIIEAIELEYRLEERHKARVVLRNAQKDGTAQKDAKLVDHVDPKRSQEHIIRVIGRGSRLAAPGITRMTNVEPREINLCSYNKVLDSQPKFDMNKLVPRGSSAITTDTISSRELHFFNAIYNLRADKISRFSSDRKTETAHVKGGTYFEAYESYKANIGPDSTKDTMISTHIDKRWDSLAAMPAIDFHYQEREMRSIHRAMVYGLVYKAIVHEKASARDTAMIYRYLDSSKNSRELIVSNGTVCDEFYEILDSLYISNQIVEDIYAIRRSYIDRDSKHHTNYEECQFRKDMDDFYLDIVHPGPTSLFEIPIVYYNSLPNAKRFRSELTSMVEAVFDIFQKEVAKWEKPDDVPYIVFHEIIREIDLMLDNYDASYTGKVKGNTLSGGVKKEENPVLDIIARRLNDFMNDEKTPKPADYESEVKRIFTRVYGA